MTRKKAAVAEIETTQEPPTQPASRDANGFELDAWGLPVCGPVRAARLAKLGKADPHDDPEAWADAPVVGAPVVGAPVTDITDLNSDKGALKSPDNSDASALKTASEGTQP